MTSDPAQEKTSPQPGLYLISDEEMKLIRRIRQLQAGAHLVILSVDGQGLYNLSLLGSGKQERLRKADAV